VKKGEIIAVLSDDAREAQVAQATALFNQRKAELEARRKLIEGGMMPKLEAVNLESQFKSAEAGLAAAVAERDRGVVRAPWDGIITEHSEVGGASLAMQGAAVAQMVALDPMLAVVEVSERRLGGLKIGNEAEVRLVTGQKAMGRVRYIARTASQTTRTYRVEVELKNPDGAIPDGITAEVVIPMAPVQAIAISHARLTIATLIFLLGRVRVLSRSRRRPSPTSRFRSSTSQLSAARHLAGGRRAAAAAADGDGS
jgi:membrane fusion protein, multidrug efflux system